MEKHGTGPEIIFNRKEQHAQPSQLTLEDVDQQINNIFASCDIFPDGPGEEAFWNAVQEVRRVNMRAAMDLWKLSNTWGRLQEEASERAALEQTK